MAGIRDSKLTHSMSSKEAVYSSVSALVDLGLSSETSKFEDH